MEEKELYYEKIKQMEEHSKKYEEAPDKKDFLKNVSAYEQKLILLNSNKPYEVLNYLDELDLKNTREILSELSFDEINRIVELFTTEDKQRFYKNFSDLTLVNQFIVNDKSSSNYIKDLSFDRKVDLIDSSNKETVMASAMIYETMPDEERDVVPEFITTSNSVSTLNEAINYVENNETDIETDEENLNENDSKEEVNIVKNESNEQNNEIQEENNKQESNDEKQEQNNNKEQTVLEEVQNANTNLLFKLQSEISKEEMPTLSINNEQNVIEESQKANSEQNTVEESQTILDDFKKMQQTCEIKEIEKLKEEIINKNMVQFITEEQESIKTL